MEEKKYTIEIFDIPASHMKMIFHHASEMAYEKGVLDFYDENNNWVIIRTDSWAAIEE